MKTITLVPAYGRDYKNQKEVKEAFKNGKDFIIQDISNRYDGKPANNADLADYDFITIRYKQLRNICVINKGK
jgi:hypothetical protein